MGGGYGGYSSASSTPSQSRGTGTPAGRPAPKPLPDFQKGDTVVHKAFGKGLITGLTPMGGDALVEIAFEENGTKKLMLRAAAEHMTKAE